MMFPTARAYWSFLSARFRMMLQYRAAAVAGFGTQLFWGLIRVMIFAAFYRAASSSAAPMSYEQVVSYVWLSQAMFALLPWGVDADVRDMVRTGSVAYEMLRPLDLYWQWYFRAMAWRCSQVLLRSIPMFIVAGLFFGLQGPASPAALAAYVLSMAAAVMLSCAITNLLNISLLWTVSGQGISQMLPSLVYILSGMVIPLPLFPDWAQSVLGLLPFGGLVDVPLRLYLGHIPISGLAGALAHQLIWVVATVAFGRWLLSRGVRRLVVQGG
jgi:ABC-2 type transport system permease protein